MDNVTKEYTFFWFIENYSYCWHENGESLDSSYFTIHKLEGTSWRLQLYPRGMEDEDEGHISLFLDRNDKDDGPENIYLDFELSVLAADGSTLSWDGLHHSFVRGNGYGVGDFLKIDKILFQRTIASLSHDILTVRCKIWKGEGKIYNIGQSSVRSRIKIQKYSFLHVMENFSTFHPNVKQAIKVQSHSEPGCFLSSSLYFTAGIGCEKIRLKIVPSDTNQILSKCELSLLDKSGNMIKCGETDNRFDAERKNIAMSVSLTREEVSKKKNEYLPDDKMSLICKCTFSSGIEFQTTEEINDIPLDLIKQKSVYVPRENDCKAPEKLCSNPSVSEDMKSLYIDQCLTDVELQTETKSFPAHKNVLCARSPVFRAMMTNDTKEKITDRIQVDDLEDNIVHQLLLFLYSDDIEDLQWSTATRLYYAADKYQIAKLKEVCTSYLIENLTTTNAGQLLILADTHSDNDLKKSVQDFILENDDQIFVSKEWDMVVEKNPLLVIKTMQLKYQRKNEVVES